MRLSLHPVWSSVGLHATLGIAIAGLLLAGRIHYSEKIEITVLEAPQAPRAINVSQPEPKKADQVKPRAVFGMSRKAITTEAKAGGEAVKAGNTVAKTPDNEKLRPDDVDALPVPTEEYLVTQMPQLAQEVRIPYPPEAKRKGAQGSVIMDLLIDAQGRVRAAEFVQGPEASLNAAAMAAVKGFAFIPAKLQDRAVAVKIRYAYKFVLERG